jgi:hypothetical protein
MHSNMEPNFLTCEQDLLQKLKCVGVFWEDKIFEFDVWKGLNYVDVCQVVHQIIKYAKTQLYQLQYLVIRIRYNLKWWMLYKNIICKITIMCIHVPM